MQKDILLALSLAQKEFYKYNTAIIYLICVLFLFFCFFAVLFFFFFDILCCRKFLVNIAIQQLIELKTVICLKNIISTKWTGMEYF